MYFIRIFREDIYYYSSYEMTYDSLKSFWYCHLTKCWKKTSLFEYVFMKIKLLPTVTYTIYDYVIFQSEKLLTDIRLIKTYHNYLSICITTFTHGKNWIRSRVVIAGDIIVISRLSNAAFLKLCSAERGTPGFRRDHFRVPRSLSNFFQNFQENYLKMPN